MNRKISGPAFLGAVLLSCSVAALVSAPALAVEPDFVVDEVSAAGGGGADAESSGQTDTTGTGGPLFVDAVTLQRVQQALNDSGFDAGDVDGIFGPRTKSAVCSFQERHGLEPTGGITLATLQRLGVTLARTDESPQDEQTKATAETVPLMVSRASIRQVQQAMVDAGQGWVGVDGMWTSSLSHALRRWQEAQELEVTGTITLETLAAVGRADAGPAGGPQLVESEGAGPDAVNGADGAPRTASEDAGGAIAVEMAMEADEPETGSDSPVILADAGDTAAVTDAADESGITTMAQDSVGSDSGNPAVAAAEGTDEASGARAAAEQDGPASPEAGAVEDGTGSPADDAGEKEAAAAEAARGAADAGEEVDCGDVAAHADPYVAQLHVGPAIVSRIQQMLSAADYDTGDTDGVFDSGLSYGLVRYQSAEGLEPTGTLTVRTVGELGLGEVLHGAGS